MKKMFIIFLAGVLLSGLFYKYKLHIVAYHLYLVSTQENEILWRNVKIVKTKSMFYEKEDKYLKIQYSLFQPEGVIKIEYSETLKEPEDIIKAYESATDEILVRHERCLFGGQMALFLETKEVENGFIMNKYIIHESGLSIGVICFPETFQYFKGVMDSIEVCPAPKDTSV